MDGWDGHAPEADLKAAPASERARKAEIGTAAAVAKTKSRRENRPGGALFFMSPLDYCYSNRNKQEGSCKSVIGDILPWFRAAAADSTSNLHALKAYKSRVVLCFIQ